MNAIVYTSNTGFTAQYAGLLGEKLNLPVYSLDTAKKKLDYLTWERQHPIQTWSCPTAILYAGQDNMTSRQTVERFVTAYDAALTVMENGEHWFHTPEQLAVLRAWEQENI